jgi:hypothetical protein
LKIYGGLNLDDWYRKEITEESYKELINLTKWCNAILGYHPVVIGGWAVFHYSKSLGSRDIDIVFPTQKTREDTLMRYYRENGYKEEGLFVKHYYKEVKTKDGIERIVLDACTHSNENFLHENPKIIIPWKLTEKYYEEWNIEDGVISRIPQIELLIIYKIKALCDRRYDLQKPSTEGLDREYINSKIWKDEHDINELFKQAINRELLKELLKSTNFYDYAKREIDRLKIKIDV